MAEGLSLEAAVEEAQRRGIAETDPTNDLNGTDTALKLLILVRTVMRRRASLADVRRTGIEAAPTPGPRRSDPTPRRSGPGTPDGMRLTVSPGRDAPRELLRKSIGTLDMAVEWETDLFATQRLISTEGDAIPTAAAVLRDAVHIAQGTPMGPALRIRETMSEHASISRREAITAGLAGAAASAALGACGNTTGSGTEEGPRRKRKCLPEPDAASAPWSVGAGAFGGWTALWLRRAGAEVTLVDAWGPGNSRASSGGETRLIRASYGPRRVYSAMVARSLEIWKEHQARWDEPVVLSRRNAPDEQRGDPNTRRAAVPILRELGLAVEEFDGDELARRYPQINPEGISYALFERDAGYLLARRGCERVLRDFLAEGGRFLRAEAAPGTTGGGRMRDIRLSDGSSVEADLFVFACGPWLARLFPEFDPPLVQPTRQEVFFFGPPAGYADLTDEAFPTWIDDGPFYGVPGSAGRGFKIADDTRGAPFDPTTGDRTPSAAGMRAAREYMEHRFPAMRGAPLLEARVCQYEQSADGNLIVDTHPEAANAWIAGGGSGHGYKLGAALGEMLADQALGEREKEPFFSLSRLLSQPAA